MNCDVCKQSPVSGVKISEGDTALGFTMTSLRLEVDCWLDAMLMLPSLFCFECAEPSCVSSQHQQ